MKIAAVQCGVQTEHPHHHWPQKVWGGHIRRSCAGVSKEKERV